MSHFAVTMLLATLFTILTVVTAEYQLPVRLTEHPQSQIASIGDQVTFNCEYEITKPNKALEPVSSHLNTHNTNIHLTWLFNNRPINLNQQTDFKITSNQLKLAAYKPRINTGQYRCLINNTLFSPPFVILSQPATLTLAHITEFKSAPTKSQSLSEGNVAIISCELPESNPPALPIFYHNGVKIQLSGKFQIFPQSGNLQINNVNTADSGVYRCDAINPVTKEIKQSPSETKLRVYAPFGTKLPEIVYVPTVTNRVKVGSNLTLECVANGAPVPMVSWEKFGGILPPSRSEQVFGNLILSDVQLEDKGTYVCRAETGPGQATFKTAMVDVFSAPVVASDSPKQVVIAHDSQSVELVCPIKSRPRSDIVWFYQGRQITNTNGYSQRISGDKSILVVSSFKSQKSTGIYQCYASNEYGFAQADLLLVPSEESASSQQALLAPESAQTTSKTSKPEIIMGPQNTTIYEGQTVMLLCITNSPAGTTQINWLQNELIIEPTLMRRFEINQLVGNLRIVSVQKSDAGTYRCIASNKYGMSTAEATVKVVNNGEEIIENKQVQSISSKPIVNSVPSRPSVKQIGADKILLNWELIDSNTGMIIQSQQVLNSLAYFKVEYKTARKAKTTGGDKNVPTNIWLTIDEQIDPKKREYILTDLSKFETYRFRINAFYLNGELANSQASLRFRLENTWVAQVPTTTTNQSPKNIQPLSVNGVLNLSQLKVIITQVWAIASSSLGIRWRFSHQPVTKTNDNNSNFDGFYIYFRHISNEFVSTDTEGQVKINTARIPPIPINEYTRIKVPVNTRKTKSIIDSYMIENLVESSVYEIKMSCYNIIGDLCSFSEPIYGITLSQASSQQTSIENTEITSDDPPQSVSINTASANNHPLFITLGAVLAFLTLALGVFVVMCIIRHRQHKRLLAHIHNSSQKMTSSSCPTLIYEDSLRQNCQPRKHHLLDSKNFANSTQDSSSTNSQSMSTTASSMITPPHPIDKTATPSHMLLMNGSTVQAPPVPHLPPPNIYNSVILNPLSSCVDPNVPPLSPNTRMKQQASNQENFYHTLSALGNLPNYNQPQQQQSFNDESNPYSDYTTATLNFHAQLLLKQQQQQFFINTLKNMQKQQQFVTGEPRSPQIQHSMRRNGSVSSSKKSKKSSRRENRSDNQQAQIDQYNQELQMPPQLANNYYLLPRNQQQGQTGFNEINLLEAALHSQNSMGLLNPYLFNGYMPNLAFPSNHQQFMSGGAEGEPLMLNNLISNEPTVNTTTSNNNNNNNNNIGMTIEEQEREPLNQSSELNC